VEPREELESAAPPRVTVAIPASNAEDFLGETLDSVLTQRYRDWEVVITDDASFDRTFDVAHRYAQEHPARIRVIRLDRMAGTATARNTAIAASGGGELIALLDHDDRWRPDYLEHMVSRYDNAVATGRRVGIVACNAVFDLPGGRSGTFDELSGWADPVTYAGMIERSTIFAGALFPRAVFEEVGGLAPECWGADDYDLWLRIIERGYDVVLTREPLVIYRQHEDNLSRNQLRMTEAAMCAYRRALERPYATAAQRRALRKRLRHYRALRARALVHDALIASRPLAALVLALRAAPVGLIAFLQEPRRWREWLADLLAAPRLQSAPKRRAAAGDGAR